MNKSKKLERAIKDLKETFPEVTNICDGWQQLSQIHGIKQTEDEVKVLEKFAKAMKVITQNGI